MTGLRTARGTTPRRAAWLLLAAAACAPAGASPGGGASPARVTVRSLRADVDSMLGAPEFRNAHWGILVVDPVRGDTLYSNEAGKLFMPASNMKIVTGAVALARLGPDWRFRTDFATTGAVAGDALVGDLVVIGRGDPTVSAHMAGDPMTVVRAVADSLAARGVRRITGTIRRGPDHFPGANVGFGWALDDLDSPYGAGVDELYFNEGFATLVVTGADSAGRPPAVRVLPVPDFPGIRNDAVTGDTTRLSVVKDTAGGRVVLSGTVKPGETDTLAITYADPADAYLAAVRAVLEERGITVRDWGATPARADPAAPLDTLFTLWSPPLRDVLPAMMKPSQNQIAEALFRTLALEATGTGDPDSARRVVERQLAEWGIDSSWFVVRDGSGLSRHNYLAPNALVRILDRMRTHDAASVFLESFPVAGVDGTIASRMRGTPAEGNLRAKTGTIDKARALSGYVTAADGRVLIFSLLANNFTTPVSAATRLQDAVGARLAALSR
jgi:D-alanyl-D-alanine carboxypeptidase/D-alanyl-D-alanine-endopeptidase (penicillin-binding protein 4)